MQCSQGHEGGRLAAAALVRNARRGFRAKNQNDLMRRSQLDTSRGVLDGQSSALDVRGFLLGGSSSELGVRGFLLGGPSSELDMRGFLLGSPSSVLGESS